ncbi:MAG: AtpZ/AtpI family protein [bacterium]
MMSQKSKSKTFYALSLAWQLGFIIIIPIGGFLFLGVLGDKVLKTKPLFLIIGLLVGIIVTVYEVYHLIVPLIKDKEDKEKND